MATVHHRAGSHAIRGISTFKTSQAHGGGGPKKHLGSRMSNHKIEHRRGRVGSRK